MDRIFQVASSYIPKLTPSAFFFFRMPFPVVFFTRKYNKWKLLYIIHVRWVSVNSGYLILLRVQRFGGSFNRDKIRWWYTGNHNYCLQCYHNNMNGLTCISYPHIISCPYLFPGFGSSFPFNWQRQIHMCYSSVKIWK